MTRLTKQIRERMVNVLLKRRFTQQGEALAALSAELFNLAYEDRYDADTRRLMTKLQQKFGRSAFYSLGTIKCRTPLGQVPIGRTKIGEGSVSWTGTNDDRPVIEKDRYGDNSWTYTDCQLGERMIAFANAQRDFAEEVKAARSEALSALSTVTTAKQLNELWPEAMPIIGNLIPVPSGSNLPAVQFSKLTEAFGLGGAA